MIPKFIKFIDMKDNEPVVINTDTILGMLKVGNEYNIVCSNSTGSRSIEVSKDTWDNICEIIEVVNV